MKKRIHVNQHNIRHNRKVQNDAQFAKSFGSELKPVVSVKTYKGNHTANHVWIDGPSVVVYEPCKPLSCGAHVWIETDHDVVLDGKERIT